MEVERYHQTGTLILGGFGVSLAVVGGVAAVSDEVSPADLPWLGGFLLMGVLSWAALVRPQVRLTADDIVLRNMLETVTVPLVAVEEVRVSRVLAIRAGERRFVSPAVSRSLREVARGTRTSRQHAATHLPDFVEERIRSQADGARVRLGVRRGEVAPDVRRQPAWAEIGLLVLGVLMLLVGLVL